MREYYSLPNLNLYCQLVGNVQLFSDIDVKFIYTLILDAIILPLFWGFAFCFITSIGYSLVLFKEEQANLSRNIFTHFWYGLALLVIFLQIWNLFFPVNFYAWGCLLPVVIYGAANFFRRPSIPNVKFPGAIPLLFIASIFVFLVISSFDNLFNYDTLAYQFYSIKWINSYPATKGLGNLYLLLAYNQSYFLFPAFLNAFWGSYKGACATNGLLALVICAEIVLRNAKYLMAKEKFTVVAVFQLLFLPLCINVGVQNLTSPYPDVIINLLTFKVLSDFIACIEKKEVIFQDFFFIAFYCVLGVVMKLSFAGVALGSFVVIISILSARKLLTLDYTLKAVVLFSLLVIPWMIRGVFSSGYIGYPASILGLPVDWKMPATIVRSNADFTVGFSRTHVHGAPALAAAHGYKWLPAWIKSTLTTFGFYMPVIMFIGVCIISRLKKIKITNLLIILVPVFTSIIFWFFTAPDLRFVVFTFWGLGLASLAYLFIKTGDKWIRFFPIFIYSCSIIVMAKNWNKNIAPLGDLPKQKFSTITTRSGLKIKYISGNPTIDDWQIGDCTIPCTVFPDTNIILRGKDIKDGFRTINDDSKKPALTP